ncbi:MAG: N-acetylmuramidase family protein [Prevotella sp.]|nr:N-acetylmuramidase family protein [Prevotella sp.]MCM1075332.1 N-acetylmuramidase family protein [Ruminococcus sp.]
MKGRSAILLTIAVAVASAAGAACIGSGRTVSDSNTEQRVDTISSQDSTSRISEMERMAETDGDARYKTLTDEDYRVIANELDVEIAAIKAVVHIEAGKSLEGFFAPGVPVINFDRAMYNKAKPASNAKAPANTKIPDGIKSAFGKKEWQQLINARKVNIDKANMGTFWGMFQIGGFNYKLCGCASVQEFVDRMSYSEFEQLELFANFIKNTGMLTDLKNKNWAGFARKYNGASYKARGYHTRMAREYQKYKAQEK